MEHNSVHRRENIIWNAIDLMHEHGVHSVSTKEIARRLGISEGTIFNYFPKKNDLLVAVLDLFCLYDKDIYKTSLNKKENAAEAILFYIESYLVYYENYPAVTALMQAGDVLRGVPLLEEKYNSILLTRIEHMRELVRLAQEAGVICRDRDADVLADIFTSTCIGICIRWRISNYSFPLREKTIHAISMLIDAFK